MVIKSDPFGRLFEQSKTLAFIDCLFSQNMKNGSAVSINQANGISTSLPAIQQNIHIVYLQTELKSINEGFQLLK